MGMERTPKAHKALKDIPALRVEFHENVNVTGEGGNVNMELEKLAAWLTSSNR